MAVRFLAMPPALRPFLAVLCVLLAAISLYPVQSRRDYGGVDLPIASDMELIGTDIFAVVTADNAVVKIPSGGKPVMVLNFVNSTVAPWGVAVNPSLGKLYATAGDTVYSIPLGGSAVNITAATAAYTSSGSLLRDIDYIPVIGRLYWAGTPAIRRKCSHHVVIPVLSVF